MTGDINGSGGIRSGGGGKGGGNGGAGRGGGNTVTVVAARYLNKEYKDI